MKEKEYKPINVAVERELIKKLKIIVAEKEITIKIVINDLLREYVKKNG